MDIGMEILSGSYLPGDQRLIDQIVRELKSQGIFDLFRKECLSDVDTKPAYQNLRQRVEGNVASFLKKQRWNSDMNKNHVREMLRQNIQKSGFLETGVERIVDQVVNPKISTVFLPKVEDVVYKFLGIEKPTKSNRTPPSEKTSNLIDLLPTDLEAVSPEMPEISEEKNDQQTIEPDEKMVVEENSVDSQFSVMSGIESHDSNHSHKPESSASINSSESRMSLENSNKTDLDVFVSQKSSDSTSNLEETKVVENEASKESSKSKDDRKKDRHHSSDKSKSRSDKEKSDKRKKDEKEQPKEQKNDKTKYRIPKLSDRPKESNDKDKKSDRDKDKKSSKHSSDKDRSRSRRDSKSDKERDEKRDKRQSSSSDKSKRSSRKDESSSSKDRHKESKKESRSSHSSSSRKSDSKHKDEKSKSSSSKDKDDRKKKRSSEDDHHSSKEKRNGRRSSDRDSDGSSNTKKLPSSQTKTSEASHKEKDSQKTSSIESSGGDSGNSEKTEKPVQCERLKLPKFASNFQEAMKIMKMRREMKKLAEANKMEQNNQKNFKNGDNEVDTTNEVQKEEKSPLNINDFITSSNISADKWSALEAKFAEELSGANYDSYEDPLNDEEDYNYVEDKVESESEPPIDVPEEESAQSQIVPESPKQDMEAAVMIKRQAFIEDLITKHQADKNFESVLLKDELNISEVLETEKENIQSDNTKTIIKRDNNQTTLQNENGISFNKKDWSTESNEHNFKGFVESGNERGALILQQLVRCILKDRSKQSADNIERGIKRKLPENEYNNNWKYNLTKIPKSVSKGIVEHPDISLQTGLELMDKHESQSVNSKKGKNKSDVKLEDEAKPKQSLRNYGARQRYSNEDLYKPRIALRRSRKGSKDS